MSKTDNNYVYAPWIGWGPTAAVGGTNWDGSPIMGTRMDLTSLKPEDNNGHFSLHTVNGGRSNPGYFPNSDPRNIYVVLTTYKGEDENGNPIEYYTPWNDEAVSWPMYFDLTKDKGGSTPTYAESIGQGKELPNLIILPLGGSYVDPETNQIVGNYTGNIADYLYNADDYKFDSKNAIVYNDDGSISTPKEESSYDQIYALAMALAKQKGVTPQTIGSYANSNKIKYVEALPGLLRQKGFYDNPTLFVNPMYEALIDNHALSLPKANWNKLPMDTRMSFILYYLGNNNNMANMFNESGRFLYKPTAEEKERLAEVADMEKDINNLDNDIWSNIKRNWAGIKSVYWNRTHNRYEQVANGRYDNLDNGVTNLGHYFNPAGLVGSAISALGDAYDKVTDENPNYFGAGVSFGEAAIDASMIGGSAKPLWRTASPWVKSILLTTDKLATPIVKSGVAAVRGLPVVKSVVPVVKSGITTIGNGAERVATAVAPVVKGTTNLVKKVPSSVYTTVGMTTVPVAASALNALNTADGTVQFNWGMALPALLTTGHYFLRPWEKFVATAEKSGLSKINKLNTKISSLDTEIAAAEDAVAKENKAIEEMSQKNSAALTEALTLQELLSELMPIAKQDIPIRKGFDEKRLKLPKQYTKEEIANIEKTEIENSLLLGLRSEIEKTFLQKTNVLQQRNKEIEQRLANPKKLTRNQKTDLETELKNNNDALAKLNKEFKEELSKIPTITPVKVTSERAKAINTARLLQENTINADELEQLPVYTASETARKSIAQKLGMSTESSAEDIIKQGTKKIEEYDAQIKKLLELIENPKTAASAGSVEFLKKKKEKLEAKKQRINDDIQTIKTVDEGRNPIARVTGAGRRLSGPSIWKHAGAAVGLEGVYTGATAPIWPVVRDFFTSTIHNSKVVKDYMDSDNEVYTDSLGTYRIYDGKKYYLQDTTAKKQAAPAAPATSTGNDVIMSDGTSVDYDTYLKYVNTGGDYNEDSEYINEESSKSSK